MAYTKPKEKAYKEKVSRFFNKEADKVPARSVVLGPRFKRPSTGNPYITSSGVEALDPGSDVVATVKKPCGAAIRSGVFRSCKSELMWLSPKAAKKLNAKTSGGEVSAGPVLRMCLKANAPGVLVPVRDPLKAAAISKKFCACMKRSNDAEACTLEATGEKNVRMGRYRGRRRRR